LLISVFWFLGVLHFTSAPCRGVLHRAVCMHEQSLLNLSVMAASAIYSVATSASELETHLLPRTRQPALIVDIKTRVVCAPYHSDLTRGSTNPSFSRPCDQATFHLAPSRLKTRKRPVCNRKKIDPDLSQTPCPICKPEYARPLPKEKRVKSGQTPSLIVCNTKQKDHSGKYKYRKQ